MAAQPSLIVITGATGFVGNHVLSELLEAGHKVRALVRPKTWAALEHHNLEWHRANIGDDNAGFLKDAECLIHIAGVVKAQKREDYYSVNEGLAGQLAHEASLQGVDRIVLVSSMAARKPELSDYAGSKRAGEEAVKSLFNGNIAIIRAPAVFGPGDLATAPFITAAQKGVLPVPGGRGWKTRKLSLAYVKDLAKDIAAAAVDGRYDGQTVSPATRSSLTWPEFAAEAAIAAGHSVKPLPIPLTALYAVAGVTSVSSRLFGVGHLTLGKLKEFLYDDWSSEEVIQGATPLSQALSETMLSLQADAKE